MILRVLGIPGAGDSPVDSLAVPAWRNYKRQIGLFLFTSGNDLFFLNCTGLF